MGGTGRYSARALSAVFISSKAGPGRGLQKAPQQRDKHAREPLAMHETASPVAVGFHLEDMLTIEQPTHEELPAPAKRPFGHGFRHDWREHHRRPAGNWICTFRRAPGATVPAASRTIGFQAA